MQWSEGMTTQAAGPFTESTDSPKYVVVKLFGVSWMQNIIMNDQQNASTILNPNNQQLFNEYQILKKEKIDDTRLYWINALTWWIPLVSTSSLA